MKKKNGLLLLVLYGLCAVLWWAGCIRHFLFDGAADGLTVFCAVVWTAAFFAQFCRYRRNR